MALNDAEFSALMKIIWSPEEVIRFWMKNNPTFALMKKNPGLGGEGVKQPVIWGNTQNRSSEYSMAIAGDTSGLSDAFQITHRKNYSFGKLDNATMEGSATDQQAFMRALKFEMDSVMYSLKESVCTQLWRTGTGTAARLSATQVLSSTTVVLAQPQDIVNFSYNMQVGFSATDGGAVKSSPAYIVAIDKIKGTFQLSATLGGTATALNTLVPTIAVSDYIYTNPGDVNKAIDGFQAWLPGSNVTATPFMGVNRTKSTAELAGIYLDGSAGTVEEALIGATTMLARMGASPDYCLVNANGWNQIQIACASKLVYVNVTPPDMPTIGFQGMKIAGAGTGDITVLLDPKVPDGYAFILQMDTWTLWSIGDPISLYKADGLAFLRQNAGDYVMFHARSYMNLGCNAPGYNCQLKLPAMTIQA